VQHVHICVNIFMWVKFYGYYREKVHVREKWCSRMAKGRKPSDGTGPGDGWEDAVPPAVLAGAVDAVAVDPDAPRVSTMYAAAKLLAQGLTQTEAAIVLGVSRMAIVRAVHDDRFVAIQKRFLSDSAGMEASRAAKMAYYLERAYETLHDELESKNEWLRHNAAVALIAAEKSDATKDRQRVEIIMSPAMAYDDQELDETADEMQEEPSDDAETPENAVNPIYLQQ
jgi:predicted transcriptional regulator